MVDGKTGSVKYIDTIPAFQYASAVVADLNGDGFDEPIINQSALKRKQFENVFPELHKQVDFVSKVVREEEDSFLRTLDKGLKRMDNIITTEAKNVVVIDYEPIVTITGKDVFELYDTYGFPIDLTRLIASEKKIKVDEEGFEKEMQQQKTT